MLNVGDVLQQRYQVIGIIKSGGMGAVYSVLDLRLRARFALKEALVQSAEQRAQFEREAQLLAQLDHPVLPRVVDHFAEQGGQFLVMEFVTGEDLETLLEQRGRPFDIETVLGWADQMLDALEYLHAQNPPIIHRDIKPANLKLADTGRVKLLDFGIAKAGGQTTNVAKAYSLEYSPIEQFSATTHTDARSDIYALGATLYHLIANQPPVAAPERLNGRPLPSPQTFNPDCPPALAQIILRAMALKPEHRYQATTELRAALQQLRNHMAAPAARPRRPWVLVGATAAIVITALSYGAIAGLLDINVIGGNAAANPRFTGSGTTAVAQLTSQTPTFTPLTVASVSPSGSSDTTAVAQLTSQTPTLTPLTVASVSPSGSMGTPTPTPLPTALTTPVPTLASTPNDSGFGSLGEQHPARVTASDTAPPSIDSQKNTITYDAANVVDGRADTAWRVPGNGVSQWLNLEFSSPVLVSEVQLLPGYAKIDSVDGTNRFVQNRRIRHARLEFSNGSGVEAAFADDARLQSISINPVVTSFVRIVVLETTAPGTIDGRDFTPISEVVVIGQAQITPTLAAGDTLVIQASEGVRLREEPDEHAATVYERPLLVAGSTVRAIVQRDDWWQVQTPEGVTGWLRVPADDRSVVRADSSVPPRRFADGAQVVVRTPQGLGIPLRVQPASAAAKVVELLPDGSILTVVGELGDWLRLRTQDGTEGWGRWHYDGAQYLHR